MSTNAKTRILFVDDEPMILQGLQRMLRSMRAEWETVFVESGPQALDRMERESFDVVVSDMRMPVMDGAALLNEVMTRHPRTLRFILSGHADRSMIMRCLGATHQFLSKPCELEVLKTTIQRACGLRDSLHDEGLRQLVGRIEKLPSLPSLYGEMIERLNQPEVGTDEIAAVIVRDVAMTAKILKLVNSAFFGLGRQIASAGEAVNYLGIETIKSLVLTMHVFGQHPSHGPSARIVEAIWAHSLEVAGNAKALLQSENESRTVTDEGFAGGMLHDLGKLIFQSNFPREYGEIQRMARSERMPMWRAELKVLGASHADIGGYLLGLWGLPPAIVEAVALHHKPGASSIRALTPLTAVYIANLYSNDPAAEVATVKDEPDPHYLESVECQDRLDAWRAAMRGSRLKSEPS